MVGRSGSTIDSMRFMNFMHWTSVYWCRGAIFRPRQINRDYNFFLPLLLSVVNRLQLIAYVLVKAAKVMESLLSFSARAMISTYSNMEYKKC